MSRVGTPEFNEILRFLVMLIEALLAMAAPGVGHAGAAFRAAPAGRQDPGRS